jgi:hypothetical protein
VLSDGDPHWARLAPPAAIKSDGSLWWLRRGEAKLRADDGVGWSRVAVAIYGEMYGIKRDGTLWRWQFETAWCCMGPPTPGSQVQVGTETSWVEVAAGDRMGCALRADGRVSCWPGGQETEIPGRWQSICGAGSGGVCGITPTGELRCWSGNLNPTVTPVIAKELGCGGGTACVVATDGSLWCIGSNQWQKLGIGPGQLDALAQIGNARDYSTIAIGSSLACALRGDGAMFCSGWSRVTGDGSWRRESPVQISP